VIFPAGFVRFFSCDDIRTCIALRCKHVCFLARAEGAGMSSCCLELLGSYVGRAMICCGDNLSIYIINSISMSVNRNISQVLSRVVIVLC
jgi:hypothetical protein